jgi:hypothetical protein
MFLPARDFDLYTEFKCIVPIAQYPLIAKPEKEYEEKKKLCVLRGSKIRRL